MAGPGSYLGPPGYTRHGHKKGPSRYMDHMDSLCGLFVKEKSSRPGIEQTEVQNLALLLPIVKGAGQPF